MTDDELLESLAAVAATTGGAVGRHHLSAHGLTGRDITAMIKADSLDRLHRGWYRVGAASEYPAIRYLAKVQAVRQDRPHRVITGPAAVAVLGLPQFEPPRWVHVALDESGGSSLRSVIRTVSVPPDDQLVRRDGKLLAGPARAALDSARLSSLVAGVVAADSALAREMTTEAELDSVLGTMAGLPGVERARTGRSLVSSASESPGESWSAVVMHLHGVPCPQRQHAVYDDRGLVGRVDFWWPEQQTVGEFDGRMKYGRDNPAGLDPRDVVWAEKVREDRLRALGLRVVRWTTGDLRSPGPWIRRLVSVLGKDSRIR